MLVQHFRVDDDHSNSYETWKKMGSPQQPTPEQYAQLEAAGNLHLLESPRWETAGDGRIHMAFPLPLHGVSLIRLAW
jgi:xylan 1,4-beta-xylosidase